MNPIAFTPLGGKDEASTSRPGPILAGMLRGIAVDGTSMKAPS